MREDPVDILLRLAFLEGAIGTHGAYEKALRRRAIGPGGPPAPELDLEERLVSAARALIPSSRLTVGSFLTAVKRDLGEEEARKFGERSGITPAMLRLIEGDRISPFRLPVSLWGDIRKRFHLTLPELREMIRRTCQVVSFGPALRGTLARRRRADSGSGENRAALDAVAREMLARADLHLPPADESRLRSLFDQLDGNPPRA